MKVGDLVRTKYAVPMFKGHGVILEINEEKSEAKVRWFDDFKIGSPEVWNMLWTLEVISESR